MKIIFLDIDGVVVTGKLGWDKPDPRCVAALNRIVAQTEAQIVVSSCWRVGREVIELRELLLGWGVRAKVIDRTGAMCDQRGNEIGAWLEEYLKHRDVDKFVILDDDADMAHLKNRLVKTNFQVGLTEADADRAIAMLMN